MASRLLQILATEYCCVAKFLRENVMQGPTEEAADRLGVTVRTITNYRRRYRERDVYECAECQNRRAEKKLCRFPRE